MGRRREPDPIASQERQLLSLIRTARQTEFGSHHDFCQIKTVSAYQKRVPLRTYEQFYQEYWKARFPCLKNVTWPGQIPFFALTSGTTTQTSKYIPYTHQINKANRRAMLRLLGTHLVHCPRSRGLADKGLILGGSASFTRESSGSVSADMSGLMLRTIPWWFKNALFIPPEIQKLEQWEERLDRVIALPRRERIGQIGGIPHWLWILFERQAQYEGLSRIKARDLYPNLALIIHGGVSLQPYRERFVSFLEGSDAELREAYVASEGFIAFADKGPEDGLRLIVDNGIFYEFVPLRERDKRLWLEEVRLGETYEIVVTTCSPDYGVIA